MFFLGVTVVLYFVVQRQQMNFQPQMRNYQELEEKLLKGRKINIVIKRFEFFSKCCHATRIRIVNSLVIQYDLSVARLSSISGSNFE